MIALLNETLLWWHWIILGLVLLLLELGTGTFVLLAFALAAILVGLLDYLFVYSSIQELSLWLVLSILFITVWFKWFRQKSITQSGQSNYRLNTLGTVQESIQIHSRGKVKFDTPVLGNTVWHATATVDIPKDTRVQIVQINGQLIEVTPFTNDSKEI